MDIDKPDLSPRTPNLPPRQSHASYKARQAISNVVTITPITAFLVTCICLAFDRTKILRSDDPFLLGGFIACSIGFLLLFFHLSQLLAVFHIKPLLGYLGGSALAAIFFIGYDCMVHMPEGQGIPTILGIMLSLSSVAVIPLGYIRVSKPIILGACISAILYGTGYSFTLFAMQHL